MLAKLQGMKRGLAEVLASLDPETMCPRDAVSILEVFTSMHKQTAAGMTLVAERPGGRVGPGGPSLPRGLVGHQDRHVLRGGGRHPGCIGQAGRAARCASSAAPGRAVGARLREIAAAATAENEERLLGAAERESFGQLRRTCASEKARARSAEEEQARHDRIHRGRHHRSWIDGDGAYRYEGRTTAMAGARLEAAIEAETERVFKAACAEGRREPTAAYRADAVANLITEGGASVATTVVIRTDASHMAGGEGSCETTTGPVPVDEAIGAILAGAFVKVLQTDGTDVSRVAHPGRHRPALLDTAVFERDDYRCVRPGCGATQRLEVHHHKVDYGKQGPTAYWNLATLCRHDHDLVTHGGHRLDGGPGTWSWIPPP